jgi:hypothetical protein
MIMSSQHFVACAVAGISTACGIKIIDLELILSYKQVRDAGRLQQILKKLKS